VTGVITASSWLRKLSGVSRRKTDGAPKERSDSHYDKLTPCVVGAYLSRCFFLLYRFGLSARLYIEYAGRNVHPHCGVCGLRPLDVKTAEIEVMASEAF
jgi:hypothetical protein